MLGRGIVVQVHPLDSSFEFPDSSFPNLAVFPVNTKENPTRLEPASVTKFQQEHARVHRGRRGAQRDLRRLQANLLETRLMAKAKSSGRKQNTTGKQPA